MNKEERLKALEKINHPFYCVWCGVVYSDRESFKKHYAKEIEKHDYPGYDDSFDAIHNPNNY